jgi:hypothetical protein
MLVHNNESLLTGSSHGSLHNATFEEGFPFNLRMLYSLQVELRYLDGGSPNRQETMNQPDRFQMRFDQMPNGKGKPALRLSSVEQPTRTIPGFRFLLA